MREPRAKGHRLPRGHPPSPRSAVIHEEWIERAIASPIREHVQADGRIRRWTRVPEMDTRFLRVVLLADAETVHNAFFDRRFQR